jgi:hypothetical protein
MKRTVSEGTLGVGWIVFVAVRVGSLVSVRVGGSVPVGRISVLVAGIEVFVGGANV